MTGANAREAILAAARRHAQAHGYGGLNFRELAEEVGIKAASIHYHFPSKASLGAAVAKRYWEDAAVVLEAISAGSSDPLRCLREYPSTFRISLECDNRICLLSIMAAEYDDLPDPVKKEILSFADVNVAWLTRVVTAAIGTSTQDSELRARAIFAAISGAQLMARARSDVMLFDALIEGFRVTGLLPA